MSFGKAANKPSIRVRVISTNCRETIAFPAFVQTAAANSTMVRTVGGSPALPAPLGLESGEGEHRPLQTCCPPVKSRYRFAFCQDGGTTLKKSYGQATFKQNWINKISCLFNYMTNFLSQSPSSKKTSCGNQARDKDSSLMQLRERERPEISLANNSTHGHLCVTALLGGQYTLCREARCHPKWEWSSPASWKCSRSSRHLPLPPPGAAA